MEAPGGNVDTGDGRLIAMASRPRLVVEDAVGDADRELRLVGEYSARVAAPRAGRCAHPSAQAHAEVVPLGSGVRRMRKLTSRRSVKPSDS
jgi:hypothetical protein